MGRARGAALAAALTSAGLLAGASAAEAAVTVTYDSGSISASSDTADDTIVVKDGSAAGRVAIQTPGVAIADPDGAGTACTATGDTADCASNGNQVQLSGNGGNDTLTDNLSLSNNYNSTVLSGGEGADTITGGAGGDYIIPGPGADRVRGGSAPTDPAQAPYKGYLAQGGLPIDYQAQYQYADTVSYDETSPGVTVTLDDQANDGAPGEGDDIGSDVENVSGTNNNDAMSAGAASVSFYGGLGDDTLNGGAGNDRLDGGDNGSFDGNGSGSDTLNGNGGDDLLTDSDSSPYQVPSPGDPAKTPAGTDRLNGGDGSDSFYTDAGADDIVGGSGLDDAIFGRMGPYPAGTIPNDAVRPDLGFTISLDNVANDGQTGAGEGDNVHADVEQVGTDNGADVLTGSPGPDGLFSNGGNDTVTGGGGADDIDTGNGDDTINVQDGVTDRVDGGRGNDSAVADLGGGQPDKADVLFNVEKVTGVPLPFVIDVTKIPVTPPNAAPTITVKRLTVKSAAFLKKGTFKLSVTTNEPATVVADLLGKSKYRAVGDLIIGTGRGKLVTGKRSVTVSVGKSNLKTFKRKLRTKAQRKKGITLRLRVVATDALGLATTTTKTVKVKG